MATQLLLGTGLISDDGDETTGSLLVIGNIVFTETPGLQNDAPVGGAKVSWSCTKLLEENENCFQASFLVILISSSYKDWSLKQIRKEDF